MIHLLHWTTFKAILILHQDPLLEKRIMMMIMVFIVQALHSSLVLGMLVKEETTYGKLLTGNCLSLSFGGMQGPTAKAAINDENDQRL